MGDGTGMDHGVTSLRCFEYGGLVTKILSIGKVK
jgi:hypothetical protein